MSGLLFIIVMVGAIVVLAFSRSDTASTPGSSRATPISGPRHQRLGPSLRSNPNFSPGAQAAG